MIAYSDDRYRLHFRPISRMEYEVLNELKDLSSGKADNCLKHTRFLFEHDDISMDAQKKMLEEKKAYIVRATYSGSKSIHMIVQFDDRCEEFCKKWYRNIWRWLEHNYFPGTDSQCCNPNRLTRAPGLVRFDTNKVQELLFENESNLITNNRDIVKELVSAKKRWEEEAIEEEKNREIQKIRSKFSSMTNHDGMCREYKTVKRYLETPFLKVRGNGNSATWFYAALCCCLQYNDNKTLEEVKDKARREKWTEREIEHTLSNARSAVKK